MGQTAKEISNINNEELLKALNSAYAEEWLAYYQYWIGAKIAHGPMRIEIVKEFEEHAEEELKHAGWIADRIIQLGGTPIIDPKDYGSAAHCKYDAPTDEFITKLLAQNLESERCAIKHYYEICEMVKGKDFVTFNLARKIMQEEEEHEQDLEDYILDIESAREYIRK